MPCMKKCAAALLFFFELRPPQHQLFADVLHQFGAGGGTEGFGNGDASCLSSPATSTLISSRAVRRVSVSLITASVSPCLPMSTVGRSWWACCLKQWMSSLLSVAILLIGIC